MAEEEKMVVPVAVVDPDQFNEIMARLDKIEEKISSTLPRSS
jgi:tetrahydromethanopterin S-methyltransferase subunit G